jgi:RNA polymerase I-specific transcription initiation factor RRN3
VVDLTDDQVEINNNLEEEEDEDEDDDEEDIAPMSSSLTLDPFDLLTSQDIPKAATDEDDDSDDGSDVDLGDLSSADERSDAEDTQDEMKLLNQAEKKRQAVKAMREKLDGMLFWFFRHLQECMGDGAPVQSAAEMAVERLGQGGGMSSGQSTPTSETPIHFPQPVPTIAARPAPTPAQSLAHFQTLLNLFSRQILPTSSTQHIPFLLFQCASFSHAHTDLFLGLLVSQALYASTTASPSVAAQPVSQAQRISATVYIGSVVCRARFVTDESARQVLTYLLAYIDGKLHQSHLTKRIDELPLFYAVCQAVMLIFCFRWRAFTTEHKEGESILGEMELESEGEMDGEVEGGGGDGKWIKDLDVLQRAITSDLNPLLGCNTTVVNTFAKVAHYTNFAYCFSIIEANQQSTTRSNSSHSLSTTSTQLKHPSTSRQNSTNSASYSIPRKARQLNIDAGLDSYYPFDPFTLPRSKQFIDTLYRTWGEVSIPLDESDSESEDEEEEEEEGDSEMEIENTHSLRTKPMSLPKGSSWNEARRRLGPGGKDNGLSSSLEGMSISPAQAGFMKR